MPVLDKLRRTEQPPPPQPADSDDEQLLRSRLEELDGQVAELELQLTQAERERDVATNEHQGYQLIGGSAIAAWQAEERAIAAQTKVREILVELAPLKAARGRISEYLNPLDHARTQIDEERSALAGWEALQPVLPLIDKIAAVVVDARSRTGPHRGNFHVPRPIEDMLRQLGPNATGRGRVIVENMIDIHITNGRQRIAQLTARLAAGPVAEPKERQ